MKKKYSWVLFAIFYFVMQVWFVNITLKYPYYGIDVQRNENQEWEISQLDSSVPGNFEIIRIGDIVKSVDGKNPELYDTVIRNEQLEKFHSLVVIRNGVEITLRMQDFQEIGKSDILAFLGELCCLTVAVIILIKIRHAKSPLLLALVFICGAITFMSLGANARRDPFAIYITSLMVTLVPYMLYHFLSTFFKERNFTSFTSISTRYLYLLPLVRGFLAIPTIFSAAYARIEHNHPAILSSIFLIGIALDIILLSRAYWKHRNERSYHSSLVKIIWISLLVSFTPFVSLSIMPKIIGFFLPIGFVNSIYTGSFLLLFPASFAYLMVTKQLFDLHIVARRVLVAASMALIPSVVLVLVTLLFDPMKPVDSYLLLFVLFEAIIAALLYSMEYFTTKLEPIVFPRKRQLREAIGNVASKLGTITSFRELKDIILIDIVDTMQVHGGAIVFRSGGELETIAAGHIDTTEVEHLVEATDTPEHPAYICLPVSRNEEYASFLILTLKTTNTRLGREEIEWLSLIVSYLSISLENVYLIRKLLSRLQNLASLLPDEQEATDVNWFRKLMFELQEKERARIAGDLHDTTMQDLIFLKYRFEGVMTNYSLQPKDAQEIRNLLDYVEIITTNLRQSCFELHPYLLKDHGLVETVRRLVRLEAAVCSFQLVFDADGADAIERMDLDWKKHVFRICQEFISNAKKHSEASEVRLTLSAAGGTIRLGYEDDGVGFDPNEPKVREIGGSGFGMEQLKGRILMLGGKWELLTGKGEGVQFRIQFPMKGIRSA